MTISNSNNFGIVLIILAGISMGFYDFSQKIASRYLPPFVVSLISSLVVVTLSTIIILITKSKMALSINLNTKAIIAACAVGLAAFGIEIFGVWSYSKGLPVSIGSFITAGVPAVTATTLGLLFLGEKIDAYKAFAFGLIIIGTLLLARNSTA